MSSFILNVVIKRRQLKSKIIWHLHVRFVNEYIQIRETPLPHSLTLVIYVYSMLLAVERQCNSILDNHVFLYCATLVIKTKPQREMKTGIKDKMRARPTLYNIYNENVCLQKCNVDVVVPIRLEQKLVLIKLPWEKQSLPTKYTEYTEQIKKFRVIHYRPIPS